MLKMLRIKVIEFFADNIRNLLDGGPAFVKILAAVKLGFFASIVPSINEKLFGWYMTNATFMSFVFIAIFVDHILGTYVHWKVLNDFSWRKNRDGLFLKFLTSVAGYVLLEMLHQIVADVDFVAIYLKISLQVVVFLYPTASAFGSLHILTGAKFPPRWIMKGVENFDRTGDLQSFNKTKKTNETSQPMEEGPGLEPDPREGVNRDRINDNHN